MNFAITGAGSRELSYAPEKQEGQTMLKYLTSKKIITGQSVASIQASWGFSSQAGLEFC